MLASLTRVIAVEGVGHSRADEDENGDPTQPQPSLQNILPVEAGHDRRHRSDAGVGQQVGHR